jgi:hypothetical protein
MVEPEEGRLFDEAALQVWSLFFPVMVTGPEQEDPETIFAGVEVDECFWAIAPAQAKTITQPKSVRVLVIANLLFRGMLPLEELAVLTLAGSKNYLDLSTRIGGMSASARWISSVCVGLPSFTALDFEQEANSFAIPQRVTPRS